MTQAGVAPVRPGLRYFVAVGGQHSLALKNDGTVWSWGFNDGGQLGDGTATTRYEPRLVSSLTNIVTVSAGASHSIALKSDGTVWTWGRNTFGQIGDGTINTQRRTPVQVTSLANIIAITAGSEYNLALKGDGTVWSWGRNTLNQLGDGSSTNRVTPVQVSGLSLPTIAIAAAGAHSLIVDNTGSMWAFGIEIGSVPIRVSPLPALISRAGASSGASFGLTLGGAMWAWSANTRGQVGDGTTTPRPAPVNPSAIDSIAQIGGGSWHTLALRTDGTVWAWGGNDVGQIGDGTPRCPSGTAFNCPNTQIVLNPVHVSGPVAIVAIGAGSSTNLAVSNDGTVWGWGQNERGQTGDGSLGVRTAPIRVADAGFAWHTATPRLDHDPGTYQNEIVVTAVSATPGAVIRYTTNGDEPTESDTVLTLAGFHVIQTTTLKARAWKTGQPPSEVVAATFTLKVPTPVFTPPTTDTYPRRRGRSQSASTPGATFHYTTDEQIRRPARRSFRDHCQLTPKQS